MEHTLNKIIWTNEYNFGHETIDAQHQKLVGIINQLIDNVQKDPYYNDSDFHGLLHEMTVYSGQHFSFEEDLFNDPAHNELHDRYTIFITDSLTDACITRADKVKLLEFLRNWWSHHILKEDMKKSKKFC